MSFLFTDVAGFTTMAERMDPTVLAPILNRYLDGCCDVILKSGGMVNEFIGDAILAFFGAPQDQPDHAARAVACARALDIHAEQFREAQQANGIAFGKTRIGVHTGTVFVGNVGSHEHMKYSALGDVVNTASRSRGSTSISAPGSSCRATPWRSPRNRAWRPLGRIVLKGRQEPIDVLRADRGGARRLGRDPALPRGLRPARYRRPPRPRRHSAALAADLPDDGCVALHLDRLRAGEHGTLVVMTGKMRLPRF